jgi:hypothetical protein
MERDRINANISPNHDKQLPLRLPKNSPKRSFDGTRATSVNTIKETSTIIKDVDDQGNKIINHFLILQELGRGVHGKVKLCRDILTNQEWV